MGMKANEIEAYLKHAFPDGRSGVLRVALHKQEDGLHVLRVADTGVGLPPGLDPETVTSLGLRLVRSLARQVDGRFELVPMNPGTEARITIRLTDDQP